MTPPTGKENIEEHLSHSTQSEKSSTLTSDSIISGNVHCSPLIPSRLYVGDLAAASDAALLDSLGVTHVVSCGFERGPLQQQQHRHRRRSSSEKGGGGRGAEREKYHYLCLDPLPDDPSSNLVRYLPRATAFVENAIEVDGGTVLVHCVHGQSRSCAVCVAYLMRREMVRRRRRRRRGRKEDGVFQENGYLVDAPCRFSCGGDGDDSAVGDEEVLRRCYDFVQSRRPAMAINPGFVRQLDLFWSMGCGLLRTCHLEKDAEDTAPSRGHAADEGPPMTRAHASFRSFKCRSEYRQDGRVSRFFPSPQPDLWSKQRHTPERCYRCRHCRQWLFYRKNVLDDWTKEDEDSLPKSEYWYESAGGKECIARQMHRSGRNLRGIVSRDGVGHLNDVSRDSPYIFHVEPMDWMQSQMLHCPSPGDSSASVTETDLLRPGGQLSCPGCYRKIGTWNFLQDKVVPDDHPYACVHVIASKVDLS